jgi:polysaccharide biosynthesis transport protein
MESSPQPAYANLGALPRELAAPVLSLRQLWVILWAHRLLIAAVTVLSAILGALILKFVIPHAYVATATLLVAYKNDDPVAGQDAAQINSWSFMGTQVELLQSTSTLLPVVDKLKLIERKEYLAGYRGDGSRESLRQYAVTRLWKKLKIVPGQASRFIYLSAEDKDPVMAATLANAVADTYLDEQMRQMMDPARERIERYSGQLEHLRRNVEAAQAKVSAFRQKTGLIDLTERTDLDAGRLTDLTTRLTEATAARQEAELRLSRVSQADAGVLNSPLVASLKTQLQQKEAQLAELRGSLGSRHPQIVSLQGDMAQLNAQLDREIGAHVQSARAEVASARAIEERLRAQVGQQRGAVMETRTQQDEGSSLLQELESATKVYQSALDAFERAQLGTQIAASNVSLTNRASPPSLPKAGRTKMFLFAVALGFVLSAGGSLIFELLNRRVRCREDLENDLGVHVLVELRPST